MPAVTSEIIRESPVEAEGELAAWQLGATGDSEPRRSPAARALRLARLGAVPVVTIGLLWYFLRSLPPQTVGNSFRNASAGPMLLAAAAAATFLLARALRYRLLLTGAAGPPPAGRTIVVTFASWWPGLLLPGVAADAAFVYLANRRLGSTVVRATGAALAARVLDVASLLAIGLAVAPVAGVRLPRIVYPLAGLALLAGVVVLGALRWRRYRAPLLALLAHVPGGRRITARADQALQELGSPRRVAGLAATTAAARFATAIQYTALFAALGHTLSIWQAWFALTFRTLLLVIPLQGVAGLGTTQLWWTTALVVLGWPARLAATAGFQIHLLDLSVSLPLGLAGVAALVAAGRWWEGHAHP